jgi:hypothetical protein
VLPDAAEALSPDGRAGDRPAVAAAASQPGTEELKP